MVASLAAMWESIAGASAAALKLVMLDVGLPGFVASALVADIKKLAPSARILAIAETFSPDAEVSLLKTGIAGCCTAQLPPETIARIIDMVLDGGVWISHAVMPLLLHELHERATPMPPQNEQIQAKLTVLTPRERQIAQLVGSGANNKLIARQLNITDRTVKTHLSAIFQKLGTPDRLQLALYINVAADTPPATTNTSRSTSRP